MIVKLSKLLTQRCLPRPSLIVKSISFPFSGEKEKGKDKKGGEQELSMADMWQSIANKS